MSFKKVFLLTVFIFISMSIYSQTIDKNMTFGIENYKKGKFLESINYFNIVLELENDLYNEALFWKAKSYYNLKYYNESKVVLEYFFRKGNINTSYYEDARFLYCKVFFKLEKYNDALLLFNQFFRNKTFTYYKTSVLFWIGECYLQLSDLDKAKISFQDYLKLKPESNNARDRIILINKMKSLLVRKEIKDVTIIEKANWFVEYIVIEGKKNESNPIAVFLNSFKTREDFFKWLDNYNLNNNLYSVENNKLESLSEKKTIIDDIEVKEVDLDELDAIEKALLDELEAKLIDQLGVGN